MSNDPLLIDVVPGHGTRWFHWDDGEKKFHIEHVQDVGKVLDANKEAANHIPQRGEMRKVASIPVAVVGMWIQKYGVDPTAKGNEALLMRLLNDPDWRHLRTDHGSVL